MTMYTTISLQELSELCSKALCNVAIRKDSYSLSQVTAFKNDKKLGTISSLFIVKDDLFLKQKLDYEKLISDEAMLSDMINMVHELKELNNISIHIDTDTIRSVLALCK